MIRFTLCCLLLLSVLKPAQAQSLLKQADRQFDRLSYMSAVDLYEQVLKTPAALSEGELRAVRAKLAYCYRQVRDTPNAEKAYRDLMSRGRTARRIRRQLSVLRPGS